MTASEKLRALREVPYNTALSHSLGSLTTEEHQAAVDAIATVFRALPLIADVVEAAEGFFPEHLEVLQSDLPCALTALNAHLEGGDE